IFFSSRRRHTISKRDWSSDVCSSDLECVFNSRRNVIGLNSWYQEFSPITFLLLLNTHSALTRGSRPPLSPCSSASSSLGEPNERSEERRVGKDWRCGRSSCL